MKQILKQGEKKYVSKRNGWKTKRSNIKLRWNLN
jgi:hypothetical protein